MLNLYPLIRPLLFSMDAEKAHHFTLGIAQKLAHCQLSQSLLRASLPDKPLTLMGLNFKNPIGLAAGLDKNGAYIDTLALMGFGFIEVGTVTPKAQDGKPLPRLFRLPEAQALINRMGFNNHGLETFLHNVKQSQFQKQGGILGLNIGKNASTPMENAIEDYLIGLEGVYPFADYITINISSPNTANLRSLQTGDELAQLLQALSQKREALSQEHQVRKPIAIKIAPDLDASQIQYIADLLVQHGMDAVIATNTTLDKTSVQSLSFGNEEGGLSGHPVFEKSNQVIHALRQHLGKDFPIIGVGGILSANDALAKLAAGANAVQLYSGLIYRGPKLVADCVKAC